MQQICTKYDILEGAKVLTFKKGTDIPFRVTGYSVNRKKQIDVMVSKTSEDIVKRIYDMSTVTWFNLFPYENEEIELMDILDLHRVKTKFLSFNDEVEIKYGNLKYFSILLKQLENGGGFSIEAKAENRKNNSGFVYKQCVGRPTIYIGTEFIVIEFKNYKFAIRSSAWKMDIN